MSARKLTPGWPAENGTYVCQILSMNTELQEGSTTDQLSTMKLWVINDALTNLLKLRLLCKLHWIDSMCLSRKMYQSAMYSIWFVKVYNEECMLWKI